MSWMMAARAKQKKTSYIKLGTQLKKARLKKDLSQAEVARKLNLKSLEVASIEAGLPESWLGIYQRGYVESYARLVDVKIKLEDFNSLRHPTMLSPLVKPINQRSLVLSQLTTVVAVLIVVAGIIGYVGLQVVTLISPPSLSVNNPQDGFVTGKSSLEVRGKTTENTDVSINGVSILTEPDGSFSSFVPLKRGVNDLTITATNRLAKQTSVHKTVVADYQIDPISF